MLSVAVALLVACGSDAPRGEAAVYTVRGIVRQLPRTGDPASSLMIQHEAIPEFVGRDGAIAPMESMTMPFPAEASLLDGLAVGDRVELTFAVRWQGSPPLEVTRLVKLAADTRLSFEAPPAPAASPGADPPPGDDTGG